MDRLLIASSPVEIEAKAGEAGLSRQAHDVALGLLHELTDRVGQAARLMSGHDTGFPASRFYFAETTSPEMSDLMDGLRRRPDFTELEETVPAATDTSLGLFSIRSQDGMTGLLVRHQTQEGLAPLS